MKTKASKLVLRIDDDARADLETLARRHGRTLGAEMRAALDLWREMHRAGARLDLDDKRGS